MAEPIKGMIIAGLDVDLDNIESWNRWYDQEHLAPNIALAGVVSGHRYVAPPELHDSRRADPEVGAWSGGRSAFLTVYFTSEDPSVVMAAMTERRDALEATGRMAGAGRRVVRTGDAAQLTSTWSDDVLGLDDHDLPHVGHAGLRLTLDCDSDAEACGGTHVMVSLRFRSTFHPDAFWELQLLDSRADEALPAVRAEERPSSTRSLDAGFEPIRALNYSFARRMQSSSLPPRIDDHADGAPDQQR